MYCLDTDALSAIGWPRPPRPLVRRVADVPLEEQSTTAITLGEIAYGLAKRRDRDLEERTRALLASVWKVHDFDAAAAEVYGPLRAQLEQQGRRLAEPDLRIASIALARDLTLVTGNVKHFGRVPDLRVENWFE